MGIRVVIKVLLALALSAVLAVWGFHLVKGRKPDARTGAGLTVSIFLALVVLDASIGW